MRCRGREEICQRVANERPLWPGGGGGGRVERGGVWRAQTALVEQIVESAVRFAQLNGLLLAQAPLGCQTEDELMIVSAATRGRGRCRQSN